MVVSFCSPPPGRELGGGVRSSWVAGYGADAWNVFEGTGGGDSFDELLAEGLEAVFGGHFLSVQFQLFWESTV